MATNQRDVKMSLSVETLGTESVKKLQSEILALGKNAGDAAPEFQRLADEIGALGDSAGALRSFETLSAQFDKLKGDQAELAATSERLSAEFVELGKATQSAGDKQQEAQVAFNTQQAALRKTAAELRLLNAEYRGNARDSEDYQANFKRLTELEVQQGNRLDELRLARTRANAEAKAAAAAEKEVARSMEVTENALDRVAKALKAQTGDVEASRRQIEALGLSSTDLGAAQLTLVQRMNAVGLAAGEQQDRLEAAAAATARLAAESERAAAAQEAQLARERSVDAQQQAILERSLAEERRVADLKAAIRERLSAGTAERAQRETNANAQALAAQLAAEQAASDRVIALKQALRDRVTALIAEREAREKQAFAETAAAAKASAAAVESAFSTLGVRGVQELEREILEVRNAMDLVRSKSGETGAAIDGAMRAGEARINGLQREIRELTGQLTLADRAADLFRGSMGQIAAGNLVADALGSLVEKVKELGRQFIAVNVQAETARRALTAIYKDANVAAQQFSFLQRTAGTAGVSVGELTDSFVKFSAATASSNIPLSQTNELFASLTNAGATLGLSSERVNLALNALGQIASKGVVSMEELRQQLGDSLPGALSLTAKGLGVTDAQLISLVETGRLSSRDFFPALNKGLKELQSGTSSLTTEWNRFKNALTATAQAAGDGGGVDVLRGGLVALGAIVQSVTSFVAALFEGLTFLGRSFGAAAAALVTLNNPMERIGELATEASNRLQGYGDQWLVSIGLMSRADASARQLNRSIQEQSQKTSEVSSKNAELNARYTEVAQSALTYRSATEATTVAQKILGDQSLDVGARINQLGLAFAELTKQQELSIFTATQGVKVAKEEAEVIERTAAMRGTEVAALDASVQAIERQVSAQTQEVAAREALAATLAVELNAKRELILSTEKDLSLRQKELDEIDKKLGKATAEAEASRAELRNLESVRIARQLASEAYADNSKRVEEFRVALTAANGALAEGARLYRAGRIDQEQYTKLKEGAAAAATRLKDALSDENEQLRLSIDLKRADNQLAVARLQAKLQEAQAAEQIARLNNDEAAATRALIQQKEIQAQITRATAAGKKEEIDKTIALIEKQIEEGLSNGTLNPLKEAELRLRIQNERIKRIEAEAGEKSASVNDKEAASLRNLNREKAATPTRNTSGGSTDTAPGGGGGGGGSNRGIPLSGIGDRNNGIALDENGRSAEQVASLRRQGGPVDASYNFDVRSRLQRGEKFTADELASLKAGLRASENNLAATQMAGPGAVTLEGRLDSEGWVAIFRRAVAEAEQDARNKEKKSKTDSGGGSSTSGSSGGYTVTVVLNGSRTNIQTASQRDADALAALLRQLETAAGRGTGG
jgi:tape measure domain-containing protein